jgi:hypothetical protein
VKWLQVTLAKAGCGERAGVGLVELRRFVCGMVIVALPTAAVSQNSERGMLHDHGGTWLNGNVAPDSIVLFTNDLVETQKENTASIEVEGSAATVHPETRVQFQGDQLVLDRGAVEVNTGRQMKVRVNCMTVIPVAPERTRYEITDENRKVVVAAYENDVKIHYRGPGGVETKETLAMEVTVHQGEQVTREERCAAGTDVDDAIDANAGILNTWWAKGPGLAAIAVLTCWALCSGGGNAVSPSAP